MATVPTHGQNIGGQSVLILDEAGAAPLFARLRSDAGANPAVVPNIRPGSVTVAVRNATSRAGLGGQVQRALLGVGFAANAPAANGTLDDPGRTEIRYRDGAEDKGRLVLAALQGNGRLVRQSAADSGNADVVVVLGNDFSQVVAPTPAPTTAGTGSSSSTAATSATTPPAPGTGTKPFPAAGC
jgi:hypothetical protein